MTHRVEVLSWDEVGCVDAIEQAAAYIEQGVLNLVEWDEQDAQLLRFEFGDDVQHLSEPAFIDWASRYGQAIAPALRRLWLAFDEQAKQGEWDCFEAWYDNQVEALGHFALALARVDPEAFRLIERWWLLRDFTHANFADQKVLPVIANVNGWSSADAIRFGMTALMYNWTRMGGADLMPDLVRAARTTFSPSEFHAVYDQALVAQRRYREPDPGDVLEMLDQVLDREVAWDREVRRRLVFE